MNSILPVSNVYPINGCGQEGFKVYDDQGRLHNENGPAVVHYHTNGLIKKASYYIHGVLHNVNGPAVIYYDDKYTPIVEKWYINGAHIPNL